MIFLLTFVLKLVKKVMNKAGNTMHQREFDSFVDILGAEKSKHR